MGFIPCVAFSQVIDSLDFYPVHTGDLWQYRSQLTGDLFNTKHIDSVVFNQLSSSKDIFYSIKSTYSNGSAVQRIDSLGNVYDSKSQPSYPRYKLNGDSGDSWIGGYIHGTSNDSVPTTVTIIGLYKAVVFGFQTIVKVYRFDVQNPPPIGTFWMGNDHLAMGFGLIRQDAEPSDVYVLTGANIAGSNYGTILGVRKQETIPEKTILFQNFPNPFNPTTEIQYDLPSSSVVSIRIFSLLGQNVATLTNEYQTQGRHKVRFKAGSLSSGIYVYEMKTKSTVQRKRMILLR